MRDLDSKGISLQHDVEATLFMQSYLGIAPGYSCCCIPFEEVEVNTIKCISNMAEQEETHDLQECKYLWIFTWHG